MASVTEYLERLQKLTQTNCEILQAINDSFFTKQDYLTANVDNNTYVIPSFVSLENKINSLTENFNNLVYAPKTGEATFNFDGGSQTIELKGFSCTPESLSLTTPSVFNVENNQIFKDFLSPSPYINFNINTIPNDINKVVIKKVVAISDEMKSEFAGYLTEVVNKETIHKSSINISYEDLYKKISYYEKDIDYVEYDTIKQLPIRKTIGTGTYTIKSIDANEITSDLYETYTLTLKEDLKYKLFDNTIEKYLKVGDELVTYDNSAKMRIIEIRSNSRQIVIEVLNGDYVNLVADVESVDNKVSDLSKIKFYSSIDFDNDKYVNVPLEEDQYVAIFISPLNDRMNIRAPWGTGVMLNSFLLKNSNDETFDNYYKKYISNIGDILYELTSIATNGITKYSKDEFDIFTKYKPQILTKDLTVYQINSHLNNSPTIQKIRNLYNQKLKYNSELTEVQKSIDNINSTLASISFDDTTNIRSVYENQLVEYNKKRNEIVSALNNISNEIAMAANDSDVPIENAKYHIRGFYNKPEDENINPYWDHINGIRVWYRYKNKDQETGSAHSIGDNNIFSDWNEMTINRRMRTPINNGAAYTYKYSDNDGTKNEPSYNQIDIPISQGETVDIKLQILWDFGYPYIETTSGWSEVINIAFPEEFKKNIQILDIVTENNNDIETNRFNNILKEEGLITHVSDKLIDQDSTYFHQPEHIASGFYTAERRVIPLKDQLLDFKNDIISLKDEVFGYSANNLKIEVFVDNINTVISSNQTNTVYLIDGIEVANLQLTNISDRSAKLYPIFIGSRGTPVKDSNYSGFKIKNKNKNEDQRLNQYLYFRSKDAWTGASLNTQQIFPFIKTDYQLCVNSDSKFDYLEIKPNESIIIPMIIGDNDNNNTNSSGNGGSNYGEGNFGGNGSIDISGSAGRDPAIGNEFGGVTVISELANVATTTTTVTTNLNFSSSIVQFSLRTSLYNDPVSYEIEFTKDSDNMYSVIKKSQSTTQYNSIVK